MRFLSIRHPRYSIPVCRMPQAHPGKLFAHAGHTKRYAPAVTALSNALRGFILQARTTPAPLSCAEMSVRLMGKASYVPELIRTLHSPHPPLRHWFEITRRPHRLCASITLTSLLHSKCSPVSTIAMM